MQSYLSLSYEAIPSRFCEDGKECDDYSPIPDSRNIFTYNTGLSPDFSSDGCYVRRQHLNAIGRLGTSAQYVLQAGGFIGATNGVSYGKNAAVSLYDGNTVTTFISRAEGNSIEPYLGGESEYYKVLDSANVDDDISDGRSNWIRACPDVDAAFFDVS